MRGTGVSADVLPSGAIVLTTTLDGLWVLQVLSGIESLAPELGLRPVLPSAEPRESALAHPIAAELQAAGAISADGTVDPVIVEWLTVLSRRDVALLMYISTPADSAMGTKPRLATNAVMSTGRRRVNAPSRTLAATSRPSSRSRLK